MIDLSRKPITNIDLINKLINSYNNNNLSNSLIFYGPRGIGKATSAFYFISKIFQNSSNKNYKNLIYNNSHPNIRYITKEFDEKTGKYKNFITIDQVRKLHNFFHQSTFDNLPKFIVIDSSDDLNINSSNSLLKILEEPKSNTYFILIAHQISNILPTIRSRSIKFKFDLPNLNEFQNILMSKDNEEKHDINYL